MKCIIVGAASLNQTPLDWKGNQANILETVEAAQKAKVTLLCLPELCVTGYGCEDRFHSADVQERALQTLQKIVQKTKGITVAVGLPLAYGNALYNTIAIISNTRIIGFIAKQHLAGDGIHYEARWFKPWPANVQGSVKIGLSEYPIGDLILDIDGIRVGCEICEDAWVAGRPGAMLAQRGVDVILNPSASHFAFGKYNIRERFVVEGSRAFGVTYVYANLLGNEAGRAIYDGDCLIATGGALVARDPNRFSMQSFRLTTAVVDIDATRTQQMSTASFTPDHNLKNLVKDPSAFIATTDDAPTLPIKDQKALTKQEEFGAAVSLALFDYMRKSRSKGFVISLSGGADSAACAVLVNIMIRRGLEELGEEVFNRKLHLPDIPAGSIPRKLLTCVYQATKNSSDTTLDAARSVAEDVEAKFINLDIEKIVAAYTSAVSVGLQYELSWEHDDLALQNIQARARAPGVWMIANIEGKLLLTTSNRSEAAVGYCTMDGDTAGSISPIGGIDKFFLLQWLAFARDHGHYLGLNKILRQKPTAELRPGSTQTDEDDLMPYEILEAIEDMAILEKKGPRDVFNCLRQRGYVEHNTQKLYSFVQKFFTLWCRNQWKRERYALAFHVDDRNLDPRSWCRFPVLSGGFETELAELRRELGL